MKNTEELSPEDAAIERMLLEEEQRQKMLDALAPEEFVDKAKAYQKDISSILKDCTAFNTDASGALPDPKMFNNLVAKVKKDFAILKAIADNAARF